MTRSSVDNLLDTINNSNYGIILETQFTEFDFSLRGQLAGYIDANGYDRDELLKIIEEQYDI